MRVKLTAQGSLLKVSLPASHDNAKKPPKRGVVNGFSDKSRKRLLELFASLNPRKRTIFITLTYGSCFPDFDTAKDDLRAFLERLRRKYPNASGVWRIEAQKRGAPHFHLLMFNLPYIPKETIQRWWGQIIGFERPFTRIEKIDHYKKVISYAAKYVAKSDGSVATDGFNNVPYPHASADAHTGRVWGVFQKEKLPYGELVAYEAYMPKKAFLALRVQASNIWRGIDTESDEQFGFTLFMADAVEWLNEQVVTYVTHGAFDEVIVIS